MIYKCTLFCFDSSPVSKFGLRISIYLKKIVLHTKVWLVDYVFSNHILHEFTMGPAKKSGTKIQVIDSYIL